jgi:hypothetical protein
LAKEGLKVEIRGMVVLVSVVVGVFGEVVLRGEVEASVMRLLRV